MIEGNIPFVTVVLADFLRAYPHQYHLHDDLLSAGYETLTIVVNRMGTKHQFDGESDECSKAITTFLRRHIRGSFMDMVAKAPAVRIPRQTVNDAKKAGKPISQPKQVDMKGIDRYKFEQEAAVDPRAVLILWDDLKASCEDDTDLIIVTMRSKGHTDEEIAEYVDLPRTQIHRRRKQIHERYLARQQ